MTRARSGVVTRRRHKKVLKRAKGFYGGPGRLFRLANEAVLKALAHAYRGRRQRKRDFRRLWILRINAACRRHGLSYSRFMGGLRRAGVEVNRKMLAELAVRDGGAFQALCEVARRSL